MSVHVWALSEPPMSVYWRRVAPHLVSLNTLLVSFDQQMACAHNSDQPLLMLRPLSCDQWASYVRCEVLSQPHHPDAPASSQHHNRNPKEQLSSHLNEQHSTNRALAHVIPEPIHPQILAQTPNNNLNLVKIVVAWIMALESLAPRLAAPGLAMPHACLQVLRTDA